MKNDSSYVLLAILIVLLAGFFYGHNLTGEQIYNPIPQTNYGFPTITQLVSNLNESGLRLTTGYCPVGYNSVGSAVVRHLWAAKFFNPQNQTDYDYLGFYTGEGDVYFCTPSGSGALLLMTTNSCPSGYSSIGSIARTGTQLSSPGSAVYLCSNLTAGNTQVKLISLTDSSPKTCPTGYYSSGILGSGGYFISSYYGFNGLLGVSYNQVCAMKYSTIGTSSVGVPTADTLAPASIVLIYPPNQMINTSNRHIFLSKAGDNIALSSATLYHNISGSWLANQTVTRDGMFNTSSFNVENIPAGNYLWNVKWCDTSNNCAFALSNYTFTVSMPVTTTTTTTTTETLPLTPRIVPAAPSDVVNRTNQTTTTTTPSGPTISTGGGGGGGGRRVSAGAFICSNNRLDFGEECDDGNIFSDDGCTKECKIEYCGDGVIQYGAKEECDPPDEITCALGCTLVAEKPSIPISKPAVQEPVYQPPVPVYEPEKESKLGSVAKIVGIIIAVAALGSLVTWIIRKKFKRQQQPYVLPVRYSRGSK